MYFGKRSRRSTAVFLLMISLLLLFFLSSCVQINVGNRTSNAQASGPASGPADGEETAGITWTDGDLCGILFVDYLAQETMEGYKSSAQLPSWGAAPNALWYDMGGAELFLLVPRYADSIVTVNRYKDGEKNPVGDEMYTGPARPIFVLCNISDIRPDCLITVEYNGKNITYNPFISLKDGALDVPDGGGVLDLAPFYKGTDTQNETAFLGKWSLVSDDYQPDGLWVHTIELLGNGNMTLQHGPPFSDVIEIFEGTYSVNPDGSLTFLLKLTYSVVHDGAVSEEDSYAIEGTYGYSVEGENTLKLSHSKGHLFIHQENPPKNVTYTFERATPEFEKKLLDEVAVG